MLETGYNKLMNYLRLLHAKYRMLYFFGNGFNDNLVEIPLL